MSVTGLVSIFLAAILTNNFVLSKFLGICPFLGVSKKLDTAVGMSVAVIFVMTLATCVTWPIQTFILDPNGLGSVSYTHLDVYKRQLYLQGKKKA